MTPQEYRTALRKLRVSQRGASHLLGIDERTSRRYASPDYTGPIPKPIVLLLKALLDLHRQQQSP